MLPGSRRDCGDQLGPIELIWAQLKSFSDFSSPIDHFYSFIFLIKMLPSRQIVLLLWVTL